MNRFAATSAAFLIPVAFALACQSFREVSSAPSLLDYRIVDLTHAFDDETIFWPTGQPFEHERVAWGVAEGGYWYSSFNIAASEHSGTHLDAPIHFAEAARSVEQIPIEQLIGEAVVIDVSSQAAADPDYTVTVSDIDGHESEHGAIPADAIVLMRTGWGSRWPDKKAYMGTDAPGDVENLHFPGISPEAAELLVARRIAAVGIDTASMDPGVSRDFRTHQIVSTAQIPGLENVANLDQLPPRGALVFALPMKIGGGSGAPCRIIALVGL